MPTLAASWMTGQGVSSRSSHSAAAGRMTSAAKPCSQSRTSFCSSLSSMVNSAMSPPVTPVHVTCGNTECVTHG
ncbi:hypothetical protein STENM327S_04770 [Streptomyces tendae]